MSHGVDDSVLRERREECYEVSDIPQCARKRRWPVRRVGLINMCIVQARDRFFSCVAALGISWSLDTPIPSHCVGVRKAYKEACRSSWVRLPPCGAPPC